eukprot:m.432584 g.432584  ORF g.432584 m.432584 type:complete len:130 (-) comp17460_c0_seq1:249-638(-)
MQACPLKNCPVVQFPKHSASGKIHGRKQEYAAMNLAKASEEERLNVCKKYYIGGWFFLPWLWIINFFWFLPYAWQGSDPKLRRMTIISGIGGAVWIIIMAVWVSEYQKNRVKWGADGDALTANYPKGEE